jgi:release factor glutamine methyltransferase
MTFEEAEQMLNAALEGLYENREANTIASMAMEFVTGKSKMDRWLLKNEILPDTNLKQLQDYTNQLLTGKPIQYVLGEAWFAGLALQVTPDTLIPRPETEELVNWCATWATANITSTTPLKILEIGTGSGCIAIALQKKLPTAHITAVDISATAIQVASNNAAKYNAPITFKTQDFLHENSWPNLGSYDIIISNPPYIAEIEKNNIANHVLNFEPHTALFVPDNDVLVFYSAIGNFGKSNLQPGGALFFEINQLLGAETEKLLQEKNYSTTLRKDLFENERMILAVYNQ